MCFKINRVSGGSDTKRKPSRIARLRGVFSIQNIKSWFVENLRNYSNTTSLHGFNYIANKDFTRWERIFWITIVVISIIVSIVLVIVSWLWNRETPTVTVIESSHFPTWNIAFPAVTICSFNKISRKKAQTLAKVMQRPANVSESDLRKLFRGIMYFNFALNSKDVDFGLFGSILHLNNMTLSEVTSRLSPDCMDMITRCVWKGTNMRCDSLFQRVSTLEGVCCSFNYFGRSTNNFPVKIAYQVPKRPYRVTGCGYSTGISVLLNPSVSDYYGTYFSSYGFRLYIHNAYNFPDDNAETKVLTSGSESFLRINPESTYATADIKKMDIKLRNCLFSHERKLATLQRYSFTNCMAECRLEMLFKRCGCVPVHFLNAGGYRVCEMQQIDCVVQNREIFTRALANIEDIISTVQDTKSFPCNCLPDCEVNNYPSEITMGQLNVNGAINRNFIKNNTKNYKEQILLHVFFSDLMSTRYRMEIFQNWLSTLASFGGLLGLIMGFSIVSAFEFIYFLTFRPIFNYFNDI